MSDRIKTKLLLITHHSSLCYILNEKLSSRRQLFVESRTSDSQNYWSAFASRRGADALFSRARRAGNRGWFCVARAQSLCGRQARTEALYRLCGLPRATRPGALRLRLRPREV